MRMSDLLLVFSIAALLVVIATLPASAMEHGAAVALGIGTLGLPPGPPSPRGGAVKAARSASRWSALACSGSRSRPSR